MNKHTSMLGAAGIMGIAVVVGGCASSVERPDEQMQSAESAIQQAVSSDARDYEPVLLNQAQNRVADAEELIEDEKYIEATRLLEKASVDAKLAGARSDTAKAQEAVEEINSNIEALRQRIEESQ
jgi:predicted S18 family serine protease